MHYTPAFQTVGLVEQLPFPGLQEVPTLPLWISFKTLSMQKRFRIQVQISAVNTAFTSDMIERTVHEVVNRLEICRATNVAHNETYYGKIKKFIFSCTFQD